MKLRPEILTHPNIPKPLHEVNPRNIMGKELWDKVRQEVYKKYDYHCIACGVSKYEAERHKWLEAHEYYDIDYEKGIVEIESIEPLCHYCHNFIHSGRLSMVMRKEKSLQEVIDILEHGFKILSENNLKCFYFTYEFAKQIGANTYGVVPYKISGGDVGWSDWKLIWNGKEYHSKFRNYEEWQERWS